MFLYGGSTIILLFEKDTIKLPQNFFAMTKYGKELPVKMGEKLGKKLDTRL